MSPARPAARLRWRPGVVAWALWAVAMLGLAVWPWSTACWAKLAGSTWR